MQTDKAIYKPSDNIQFRVLLLNIDTKPFEPSTVQIYVTDGAQNRVKQFPNPQFKKGVFQGELQLSDSPVLGNWTVHVRVDSSEDEVKEFEVAEYVLPKFEVIVEANPHVIFSDSKIRATVSGKYTFGKLAKGKATVTAKVVKNRYFYRLVCEDTKIVKVIDVDGKKDVDFDIKEELKLNEIDTDQTVEIEATFNDELSGKEHKGSTIVTIHKTAHKVDVVREYKNIKPGLPFSVTSVVIKRDGTPVVDQENPVEFAITFYRSINQESQLKSQNDFPTSVGYSFEFAEEKTRKFEKVFLSNGSANLSIEVPKNVFKIEIDASYLTTSSYTQTVTKIDSESGQFLQMSLANKK